MASDTKSNKGSPARSTESGDDPFRANREYWLSTYPGGHWSIYRALGIQCAVFGFQNAFGAYDLFLKDSPEGKSYHFAFVPKDPLGKLESEEVLLGSRKLLCEYVADLLLRQGPLTE